jgi:hypothetical protein
MYKQFGSMELKPGFLTIRGKAGLRFEINLTLSKVDVRLYRIKNVDVRTYPLIFNTIE